MLALAGAFVLAMAGDLIQAASVAAPGYREVFLWSGTIVIAAGSVLATVGLGWIVLDVARLCPVLLEPSPSPESVLEVEE
jgi:hypothetical protein